MLPKKRINNIFLCLKLNLAKINAAKLAENKFKKVDPKVTITLLKKDFTNGSCVSTLIYASNETCSGIHSIGIDIRALALFNDVDIIHTNGIRLTIVIPKSIKNAE